MIVNPLMVTLFQLRLTRRVTHIAPAVKLAVAMPLMGVPFLLLSVSSAIPVVMLVIFLFVLGEMLWVPTSQSVVAGLAPADLRGAYMGAFGGGAATGFALAPFFGLSIGDRYGDSDDVGVLRSRVDRRLRSSARSPPAASPRARTVRALALVRR